MLSAESLEVGAFQVHLLQTQALVLVDMVKNLDFYVKLKGITLSIHSNITATLNICIDRNKIEQAVRNLLQNAVKFIGDGKTITVNFSFVPQNDVLEVAIIDDGVGIAAENLDKVNKMSRFSHLIMILILRITAGFWTVQAIRSK